MTTIRVGTSEAGGTFHMQGAAVAELLRPSYDIKIFPFDGASVACANGLHAEHTAVFG